MGDLNHRKRDFSVSNIAH